MAKIVQFTKGNGNVSRRISEVECVYNTGIIRGKKYVTLSTYGSSSRQNSGSASQVIHVDEESAKMIIDILKNEFCI